MTAKSLADARAEALGLTRHPEGGWYKETYRAEFSVGEGRAASTAIYFMLSAGETSALHRIDARSPPHRRRPGRRDPALPARAAAASNCGLLLRSMDGHARE